jgi:hypothetical protein
MKIGWLSCKIDKYDVLWIKLLLLLLLFIILLLINKLPSEAVKIWPDR